MTKLKNIEDTTYLEEVRNQYENYPYPPRDPQKEKDQIIFSPSYALDSVNYHGFEGKKDFTKNAKILIAGGGTGDATISIAEQLRDYNKAKIIHLDISDASIQVAKERAKVRQLDNITWVHGSLLNAKEILDDEFDFINCIGVLHHLENPDLGLKALSSVLKEDGIMDIMVYAKYGRDSIYHLQDLMKMLNSNTKNLQKKVDNCNSILRNLPLTNSFFEISKKLADIQQYGDVGIYDLFLHSHDICYTVPQIYEFLDNNNLCLNKFFFDQIYGLGNGQYQIETYVQDKSLYKHLSLRQRQACAELLHGKILKHHFYASKRPRTPASLDNLDNIPSISVLLNHDAYKMISNDIKNIDIGNLVTCKGQNMEVRFVKTKNTDHILESLDGHKSTKEIFEHVISQYKNTQIKPTIEELKQEFDGIFAGFRNQEWIFLRDKNIPKPICLDQIQDRLDNILAS